MCGPITLHGGYRREALEIFADLGTPETTPRAIDGRAVGVADGADAARLEPLAHLHGPGHRGCVVLPRRPRLFSAQHVRVLRS